jgi:hypothetical protein
VPSIAARGLTYLGLDVHRDTISVAVLSPRHEAPTVDRIANDEPSVSQARGPVPPPPWAASLLRGRPHWPACWNAWTFAAR